MPTQLMRSKPMPEKKRNKISWRDVLTYLLFVAFAAAVWYGHAMHSVRNTHVPVLVSYTGVPNTIGWEGNGLPDTVIVEVRDAGQRLNAYLREPPRLTIDLRSYIHGEKGTVRVTSDELRRKIGDNLQGTSRLIATTPEEIVCAYFTEQERSVPIALKAQLEMAAEYQLVSTQLSRQQIRLYGKAGVLERIDSVYTQPLELSALSDTTDVRVALEVPVNTRAEQDSIDLRIITERFTEKKITIPLRVEGVPEGHRLRLFPREVEATLRVGMSHFAQVAPRDVIAVCVYSPEKKDKLDVQLRYTNPYITAAWVYPAAVEFIFE